MKSAIQLIAESKLARSDNAIFEAKENDVLNKKLLKEIDAAMTKVHKKIDQLRKDINANTGRSFDGDLSFIKRQLKDICE